VVTDRFPETATYGLLEWIALYSLIINCSLGSMEGGGHEFAFYKVPCVESSLIGIALAHSLVQVSLVIYRPLFESRLCTHQAQLAAHNPLDLVQAVALE